MIERLSDITPGDRSALIDLLTDAVAGGASVGFLAPLSGEAAAEYWREVAVDLRTGSRLLLVWRVEGRVAGSVQLAPATRPNAAHRAEVQKLLVHTAARRRGIGAALMAAVEAVARSAGRTLLVLDTREGDDASRLYERIGYTLAGVIPGYAICSSGTRDGSAFYYKLMV
jgi:acetyltransferase